ncbi:MAG: transposase [Anaerolineae bacterium]
MPNPRQLRDWAKGQGRRAKTDRQDSAMLTGYGMSTNPPSCQPLPEAVAQWDALLERRAGLKSMLRQELNRRHALKAQQAYQGAVAHSIDQSVGWLEGALAEIEEAILEHIDRHTDLKAAAKRLRTVPGIGERNVLDILVFLHRYSALTNNQWTGKGVTACAGLDPVHHQSGTSLHKRSLISKQGDTRARSVLFMGAFGGVRGNNPLRAPYQNLVQRGKRKRVALVAPARKLLVWAWAVYRSQQAFDQERAQARRPAAP